MRCIRKKAENLGAKFKAGSKLLSKTDDFVKTGVWAKKAFERGYDIERVLGGMCNNFPVIDKYIMGSGRFMDSMTSIKSLDVSAESYQKGNTFYRKVTGYVDELANFTGTTYKGEDFFVNKNTNYHRFDVSR